MKHFTTNYSLLTRLLTERPFCFSSFFLIQLADAEGTDHMDWLPSSFPRNVRCVISAVTDSRSAEILSSERRKPPVVPVHIGELDVSARQEIVKHTLGKYNKVSFRFLFSITL